MQTKLKAVEEQRASLQALLKFATSPTNGHCNFGAMLLLSPPGDVSFLAPVAPELRGVEIVSATKSNNGKDYDIWKRTGNPSKFWMHVSPDMKESSLTAAEVIAWLQSQCQHTEAEYMKHATEWVEDVFHFYQIPKRERRNGRSS